MSNKDMKAIVLFLILIIFFCVFFAMCNLNILNSACYIIGKASLSATLTFVVWCIILEILERV